MNVTLTLQKRYNLEINGVVFKDMRVTGELEGIMELANDTSRATMFRTGSAWGGFIHAALSGGVDENWTPIRGTPDVIEAMKAAPESKPQQAADPKPYAKEPLVWPDLECVHDWLATLESTHRTCLYCKKTEEIEAQP